MKKFLCLFICALWLYSCSDDSTPTGNDLSDMKFESVSILVEGMKYNYMGIEGEERYPNYHYDTLNEVKSFDYGLTLNNSETGKIVNVDGIYSYRGQTSDGFTRILSFNLDKDANLIDTLRSQIYKFTSSDYRHGSSNSNNESYITLVNLPYTIGANGVIIIELVPPFANNISVNYLHREGSHTYDEFDLYGGSHSYQSETKEFVGFAGSAYIKIVLTPAK